MATAVASPPSSSSTSWQARNASMTPNGSNASSTNVSYEAYAPRSSEQVHRFNRIAALTAGRIGSSVSNDDSKQDSNNTGNDNTERWFTLSRSVEASSSSYDTTDPAVLNTANHLTSVWKHSTSLRMALKASLHVSQDLSNRHAQLLKHSGELSAAADRLQHEEEQLTQHAEEIGRPLQHYNAVDSIAKQLGVLFKGPNVVRGLAKLKVDADEFPNVLDEIDQAVEYFSQQDRPKDSGNAEYYRRANLLHEAALALIQEAVVDRIKLTAQQILAALPKSKTVSADQLEASLIYTRFHGISSRSNAILQHVKKRLHANEAYADLLQTCRNTYCTQRQTLLINTLRGHMDQLQKQHGTVAMTRLASVFLIRFCTVETALYVDFFGDNTQNNQDKSASESNNNNSNNHSKDNEAKDSTFQNYLTTLCSSLHRTIRRSLVTQADLDTLCQIVGVLREERTMASASPTTLAAARAITAVIQDAQERLIYCANNSLQKQVVRFKAAPKDLNYPDKLVKAPPADPDQVVDPTTSSMEAMEEQLEQVYESWFPPVRSVLKILSKIFRVVEPSVFEDLAFSSVQACTQSLRSAASFIAKRKGVLHSDLFLVKHLLILREQLSPFDIELRAVERQLDFSHAGKAVRSFLANRNRRLLFRMNDENALLQLLREGVSVQEASVDSKRDLEEALRSACNDFIEHTSERVTPKLFGFLESKDKSQLPTLLESLTSERVAEQMKEITTQMALYLENAGTQSILLKPVSRKITKALEEVRQALEDPEQIQTILDVEQTVKRTAKASKS